MTPILVMMFVSGPAAAADSLAEATEAFEAERWSDAAAAFGRVYEDDPQPKYLYAQAQALRFDGDCEAAVDVYESFIDVSASPEADAYAADAIEVCRTQLAAAAEPEPEPEPEPPPPTLVAREPAPTSDAVEQDPAPTRWHRDRLGHGLTWSGVALSVAGGVMVGLARQQARVADQQPSETSYRRELDDASALNVTGFTALGLGATLIVGGVVRFIVVSRTRDRGTARASVVRF